MPGIVYSTLLPHYAAYFRNQGPVGYNATLPVDVGGLDETWDAPDLQNMFLAMVPPRVAQLAADGNPTNDLPIIPSFHRPELVNYLGEHCQHAFRPLAAEPQRYVRRI